MEGQGYGETRKSKLNKQSALRRTIRLISPLAE
jgi:hypothetical protein